MKNKKLKEKLNEVIKELGLKNIKTTVLTKIDDIKLIYTPTYL